MRKIILFFVGLFLANLAISQTASPELVSSAGESFINTSYQLDWSIGECVTTTHSAGNYVITQGFHQNSYVITTIKDLVTDVKISVYPNPTTDFINLKIYPVENYNRVESSKVEDLQYTITDFSGKILQTKKIAEDIEQINFSNFATGTYFITISENKQLIKSFKIIKK